jgi:hypothetical protein
MDFCGPMDDACAALAARTNGGGCHGLHVMVTFDPPNPDSAAEALLSIAAVERETGLGKDTLRAWERRYGFPVPQRGAAGVRAYTRAQVDRLGLIRRALLAGHRPGRLLSLPPDELDRVLAGFAAGPADAPAAATPDGLLPLSDCVAALRLGGPDGVRHWLTRGLARTGLASFVLHGIAPLAAQVGEAWLAGRVAVYEEHLFSEAVQSVLRAGMLPFQAGLPASGPCVLLTTVPGEVHGLGLLMAEALLTLEGCRCLPLGVQTPVPDIAAAARAHAADVVGLSFAPSLPASETAAALVQLRRLLPATVPIWAGGSSPALAGAQAPGLLVLSRLGDIPAAVTAWRVRASARIGAASA